MLNKGRIFYARGEAEGKGRGEKPRSKDTGSLLTLKRPREKISGEGQRNSIRFYWVRTITVKSSISNQPAKQVNPPTRENPVGWSKDGEIWNPASYY